MKSFKLEKMTEEQLSPCKKKKQKKVEEEGQEEIQKKKKDRQTSPTKNDPFVLLSFNYLARERLRSPQLSTLQLEIPFKLGPALIEVVARARSLAKSKEKPPRYRD